MGALHLIDDLAPPSPAGAPCVLVIGNFDGVHRGHAAVLSEAVAVAAERSLRTSVLTFDPHPATVVGLGAPAVLTTMERRAQLMADLGVETVWVRRFDAPFAGWAPTRFVEELVTGTLAARVVVSAQS